MIAVLLCQGSVRTATGLTISVKLNPKEYQTGEKVTEQELKCLNIRRHRSLPEWSCTIRPYNTN